MAVPYIIWHICTFENKYNLRLATVNNAAMQTMSLQNVTQINGRPPPTKGWAMCHRSKRIRFGPKARNAFGSWYVYVDVRKNIIQLSAL